MLILLLAARVQSAIAAIDLVARYPTALTGRDSSAPVEWKFGADDIFTLSSFNFVVADQIRLDLDACDVGIGHSDNGAVWAVIMPRTRSGLTTPLTNIVEPVAHVWLRFHPRQLQQLFPPETVTQDGAVDLAPEMGVIANAKIRGSWQNRGRVIIPPRDQFTVDVDTWTGVRRFFAVDLAKGQADYIAAFEKQPVKRAPPITREAAEDCFDKLWTAFDEQYPGFDLRPQVDWNALRQAFRARAIGSKSSYAFANVVAEMLRPLRDLHIGIKVAGADIPVFDRPRIANANPRALRSLIPSLQQDAHGIQWAVTDEKIGFILIRGWNDPGLPAEFDKALEKFRDTRALILDVRMNGGGSETLAREVAGRFIETEFTYAFSQFRNGPKHTDLTQKQPRRVSPRGPWRYNPPVLLLIGQRCMSSNESFIAMMAGDPDSVTLGDHTAGSSGNPKTIPLPLGMSVSIPQWIDYLPDGKPLDERGIAPKIQFNPAVGDFEGDRDALLTLALERARKIPIPSQQIKGAVFIPDDEIPRGLRPRPLADYSGRVKSGTNGSSRPHVVQVSPQNGGEDVPPTSDLRIRFDRPMNPLALSLDWLAGGFTETGDPKYDADRFEFTIPIRLAPAAVHQVVLNKDFWADQPITVGRLDGFLSTNGERAAVFVWNFRTAVSQRGNGSRPRAIHIEPPPQSRVDSFQFVNVQFDQDMLPPENAFPYILSRAADAAWLPQVISKVDYDPVRRTFRVPMTFSPNQKPSFVLAGFQSAAGMPAEPIEIDYGSVHNASIDAPESTATDAKLIDVLSSMAERRASLTSIVEHVQTIALRQQDGLFTQLQAKDSEFRWQQPNQFYADVSAVIGSVSVFRIVCDGTNWWHLAQSSRTNILRSLPIAEVQEVNAGINDPFQLSRQTPKDAAANQRLTYGGLRTVDGRKSHVIETWRIQQIGEFPPNASHLSWIIDAETFRIVEVAERYASGLTKSRFIVESLNQPLSPELFSPLVVPNVQSSQPEPLTPEFTHRFINLKDGADGKMTVRWGRKGPKHTNSAGLN